MAALARNIACFALIVSILALQVPSCIIDQRDRTSAGTTSTTTAGTASPSAPPALFDDGALKAAAMLALVGMDALFIATGVIYSRHTQHAAVGVGGRGCHWCVSELALFVLCLQVGVLLFVLVPATAADATARAVGIIGTGAARALPCVASITFFLGITLIYAHVGNAGGSAGGAVAGNGPFLAPGAIRLLANTTLGAALACLMSTTLALFYNNTK